MALAIKQSPTSLEDETRWQAVLARDRRQDNTFVYAVRSTGIYCRPSCPSRRPRHEQVAFFQTPQEAESAGFRACLRCRPRDVAADIQVAREVCQAIEHTESGRLSLAQLSAAVGLSSHHLERVFKSVTGVTPRQYAEALRLARFKSEVRNGHDVTNSLYEAGYGSSSRLYEHAPSQLGMTPASYRKGGKGARIGFAIADSPLGRLLIAATERGICAVRLGDDDAELEAGLRRKFYVAEVRRAEGSLQVWVEAILDHLGGQQPRLDLPLDIQATAFQRKVWQALQSVPYGATCSYRQVAESVGHPTAVRAVARACASNPVALIVPCHRVVQEDGGLGGYRWGIERKRALLEREKATLRAAKSVRPRFPLLEGIFTESRG